MADSGEGLAPNAIDAAMAAWRQGDCVVGDQWFVSRVPLDEEGDLREERVPGLVVLSQTCDVVRSCVDRPLLEVAALVQVEDDDARHQIVRGRRPRYAAIPALHSSGLVADLDRVMSVDKAVAARWSRTPGWTADREIRAFQDAIARKRARFAFPDDFNRFCSKLVERLKKKHDKSSEEGAALRELREIRVAATPSWDAAEIELLFWFIRDETHAQSDEKWSGWLESWLSLMPAAGRFVFVAGDVVTLEDMTARDYVDSDRLDLDQLSLP